MDYTVFLALFGSKWHLGSPIAHIPHFGPFWGPRDLQIRGSKMRSKSSHFQTTSRWGPKWGGMEDSPSTCQNRTQNRVRNRGPKWPQNGPKMGPKWTPKWVQNRVQNRPFWDQIRWRRLYQSDLKIDPILGLNLYHSPSNSTSRHVWNHWFWTQNTWFWPFRQIQRYPESMDLGSDLGGIWISP